MDPGRSTTRLAAEVLFVGVAWGAMYALYPVGLERSGPVWLAALRFDCFFVGAALVALWRRTDLALRGPRDHGPQRANLASYVSPVAASLAAWLLLGQGLRPVHALAYALVAAGLTLALRARAAAPPAPE